MMLRRGQTLMAVVLMIAAFEGSGCKKDKKKPPAAAKEFKPIPAPKEVMVYVGLRHPAQTLDEGLSLVREFVPLPFNRAGLLDLFAQRAKLPREMIAAVDITKPLWVVGMDEGQLGTDPDPLVMVLHVTSRKAFEQALAKKLTKAGKDGQLTLYKPKPGAVGTHPVKLLVTNKRVWAASSSKAFQVAEPFVRGTLLARPPEHDIAIHLAVENILKVRGSDLDRKVDQAMDRMRDSAKRSEGPIDHEQVAGATERTVRRWLEALRSTREAQLNVDVNREQLTVSLRALAAKGGRLAQLAKRQQPGPPFGYELMPASSWLVLSDHGNPAAQAENRKTWQPLLKELLKGMAPNRQEKLVNAVTQAAAQFTGDYTVALHRGPGGSGLTCSVVGRIADQAKALSALDDVARAAGAWVRAVLAKSKEKVPKGVRVVQTAFSQGKARGKLFALDLELPQDKRAQVEGIVGLPITLGVAFTNTRALVSLGKDAKTQLEALVKGTDPGGPEGTLRENKAYSRAREVGADRVGLLYVSLVDLVRWFEGTGIKELETIAAALKGQQVSAAPSLDWGVNEQRTALDLTLHLPTSHFRVFKPIAAELRKKGFWGGRRQPDWEDF